MYNLQSGLALHLCVCATLTSYGKADFLSSTRSRSRRRSRSPKQRLETARVQKKFVSTSDWLCRSHHACAHAEQRTFYTEQALGDSRRARGLAEKRDMLLRTFP